MKRIDIILAIACCASCLCAAAAPSENRAIPAAMEASAPSAPGLTPLPAGVTGVASPVLDLNGVWQFAAGEGADFKPIEVPGEWAMQGFSVKAGDFASYRRDFEIPADWNGNSCKLRFDAVHAVCTVWVNGRQIGGHEGGFVPFEVDITTAAKPGRNELIVKVQSESIADSIACTSQYAAHQVGGILRKLTLFCVPPAYLASQTHEVTLQNGVARLTIHPLVCQPAGDPQLPLHRLLDPDGKPVAIANAPVAGVQLIQIPAPRLWTSETPALYTLETTIGRETVRERIGLREIKVSGNRLLINGSPVKLVGVNRHEVHPLRGRSLTPELCRKDAELFRAANVNLVRTSHYPPSEDFLTACDELGIFVECEAAVCWVKHAASPVWQQWNHLDPKYLPYLLRANLDNLAANRNHPCIILWSLANESLWSPLFAEVLAQVKQADPSRPVTFHDQCWDGFNNAGSTADIANYHYPSENNSALWSKLSRPVWFGEYAHVQCYNRRELVTDPGIRADWGRPLARMVDRIWEQPGCLGGAIWSGLDDVFQLPNGELKGYGHWGPIDGWRREKPEYHGMRAAYTPVRFLAADMPTDGPLTLTIQNRFNFTDLADIQLSWRCGKETGTVQLELAPHATGKTTIQCKSWQPGATLVVTAATADGRMVGATQYSKPAAPRPSSTGDPFRIRDGKLVANGLSLDLPMPMVLPLNGEGGAPTAAGTQLSNDIAPFTPLPAHWQPVLTSDGNGVTTATGETDELKARLTFTRIASTNRLRIDYELTLKTAINPRQWGLVFTLPGGFETLIWNRRADGEWVAADQLNRPNGTSHGHSSDAAAGSTGPGAPRCAWKDDPHPLGCPDFRATRTQVSRAVLTTTKQDRGLAVLSPDGSQAIRAWLDGNQVRLLVAGFNTGGSDSFFAPHYAAERRPLNAGDVIRSSFEIINHP